LGRGRERKIFVAPWIAGIRDGGRKSPREERAHGSAGVLARFVFFFRAGRLRSVLGSFAAGDKDLLRACLFRRVSRIRFLPKSKYDRPGDTGRSHAFTLLRLSSSLIRESGEQSEAFAGTAAAISEIPAQGRHAARVRAVDRLLNAASGIFVTLLELPNPNLEIPARVTCTARAPEPVEDGGVAAP
jgi:hypothetical protein